MARSIRVRLNTSIDTSLIQLHAVAEDITSERLHDLMQTIKDRMRHEIYDNGFKSTFTPSATGYVKGSLGKSIHFRTRSFTRKGGEILVRGYFSIGEGLPYAAVQDSDVPTIITPRDAPFLVFFDHNPNNPRGGKWVSTKRVVNPGRPFVAQSIEYGLRKMGY